MIRKIIILGIIALAVIAVAVMPSPGNFSRPSTEDRKTIAVESSTTTLQVPVQNGEISDSTTTLQVPVQNGEISDPATGPAYPNATQPASEPTGETVPQPVSTNVTVTVAPEQVVVTVDQTFIVDVWINNVTNMAGWELRLVWNKEIIKCTKAQVNTPPEWGGIGFDWFNKTASDVNVNDVYTAWQMGEGIENDYNDTCGLYFKSEIYGPNGGNYRNTFNGSIAVVTLTFQALHTGSTSLGFYTAYGAGELYGQVQIADRSGIKIADGEINPVTHTVYNGFVEVQAP